MIRNHLFYKIQNILSCLKEIMKKIKYNNIILFYFITFNAYSKH